MANYLSTRTASGFVLSWSEGSVVLLLEFFADDLADAGFLFPSEWGFLVV